jgi:hypothetical protein
MAKCLNPYCGGGLVVVDVPEYAGRGRVPTVQCERCEGVVAPTADEHFDTPAQRLSALHAALSRRRTTHELTF